VRGRHSKISWIVSSQCLNLICLPVRKNVRNLIIYRARSQREIESLVEELAAVYDKETLLKIYNTAVNDEPFSFLTVKLDAADRRDMFWLRWEARIIPEDLDKEQSEDDERQPVRNSGPAPERLRKP